MKANIIVKAIALAAIMTSTLMAQTQRQEEIRTRDESTVRHVPARIIPVPATVSPELKAVIAQPLTPMSGIVPKTTEDWHELVAKTTEQNLVHLAHLCKLYPTDIKSNVTGGINTFVVTPESISEENSNRVLIHLRGGAYVFNGGEGGLGEAVLMAFHGKIKVISVDYRMAPDFPFPAALDDAVTVYNAVRTIYKPGSIGIFGTSAGGGLTAATVLKLRELNIPLPGAVGLGTPWGDLTKTGDTCYTNEYIDDVLIEYGSLLEACAKLYAGTHDMKDPFISPIYGDFSKGFPATILTSGTRDLLLSDTVRMHRSLRRAGVDADLQVFEGISHAQYILAFTSQESKEAFQEIARFFGNHLAR
jgi:epsilon-lactone hydrolase